ncbi:hypothetical protein ACQ5SK_30880 [Bradyrhizobium japonicum]
MPASILTLAGISNIFIATTSKDRSLFRRLRDDGSGIGTSSMLIRTVRADWRSFRVCRSVETRSRVSTIGWRPREDLERGLAKTGRRFSDNRTWCQYIRDPTITACRSILVSETPWLYGAQRADFIAVRLSS